MAPTSSSKPKTTTDAPVENAAVTGEPPVVQDRAVDLPTDTEAAAKEAATTAPDGELHDVNPATVPGDNLAPNQTLTENPAGLPGPGTGYHCGICGQPVSDTGEHYDGAGDVVSQPHANTMVVADQWPAQQEADNRESAARFEERKAANEAKTGNNK